VCFTLLDARALGDATTEAYGADSPTKRGKYAVNRASRVEGDHNSDVNNTSPATSPERGSKEEKKSKKDKEKDKKKRDKKKAKLAAALEDGGSPEMSPEDEKKEKKKKRKSSSKNQQGTEEQQDEELRELKEYQEKTKTLFRLMAILQDVFELSELMGGSESAISRGPSYEAVLDRTMPFLALDGKVCYHVVIPIQQAHELERFRSLYKKIRKEKLIQDKFGDPNILMSPLRTVEILQLSFFDRVPVGLGLAGDPPSSLKVAALEPDSWGLRTGLAGGDILSSVQGLHTAFLTRAQIQRRFREIRPLHLVFIRDFERLSINLQARSVLAAYKALKPGNKEFAQELLENDSSHEGVRFLTENHDLEEEIFYALGVELNLDSRKGMQNNSSNGGGGGSEEDLLDPMQKRKRERAKYRALLDEKTRPKDSLDSLYEFAEPRHVLPLWEPQLQTLFSLVVDGVLADYSALPGAAPPTSPENSKLPKGDSNLLRMQNFSTEKSVARSLTFEEFEELCVDLLREAGCGEPLDKDALEETWGVLRNLYKSRVTLTEFAQQLRIFHLRPHPDVLLPPVDVFTAIFHKPNPRLGDAHLPKAVETGFSTVGNAPDRRLFIDKVIHKSWAARENLLPGMEIIALNDLSVSELPTFHDLQYLMEHERPLKIRVAVYQNVFRRKALEAIRLRSKLYDNSSSAFNDQKANLSVLSGNGDDGMPGADSILLDFFALDDVPKKADLGFKLKDGPTYCVEDDLDKDELGNTRAPLQQYKMLVVDQISQFGWARAEGVQPEDRIVRINSTRFPQDMPVVAKFELEKLLSKRPLRVRMERCVTTETYEAALYRKQFSAAALAAPVNGAAQNYQNKQDHPGRTSMAPALLRQVIPTDDAGKPLPLLKFFYQRPAAFAKIAAQAASRINNAQEPGAANDKDKQQTDREKLQAAIGFSLTALPPCEFASTIRVAEVVPDSWFALETDLLPGDVLLEIDEAPVAFMNSEIFFELILRGAAKEPTIGDEVEKNLKGIIKNDLNNDPPTQFTFGRFVMPNGATPRPQKGGAVILAEEFTLPMKEHAMLMLAEGGTAWDPDLQFSSEYSRTLNNPIWETPPTQIQQIHLWSLSERCGACFVTEDFIADNKKASQRRRLVSSIFVDVSFPNNNELLLENGPVGPADLSDPSPQMRGRGLIPGAKILEIFYGGDDLGPKYVRDEKPFSENAFLNADAAKQMTTSILQKALAKTGGLGGDPENDKNDIIDVDDRDNSKVTDFDAATVNSGSGVVATSIVAAGKPVNLYSSAHAPALDEDMLSVFLQKIRPLRITVRIPGSFKMTAGENDDLLGLYLHKNGPRRYGFVRKVDRASFCAFKGVRSGDQLVAIQYTPLKAVALDELLDYFEQRPLTLTFVRHDADDGRKEFYILLSSSSFVTLIAQSPCGS